MKQFRGLLRPVILTDNINGLPCSGVWLDVYSGSGASVVSPGLGKKPGIHTTAPARPGCGSGRGFAEVLVAVTGASGPLWLCYAADPTAERGRLEPAARRGENFSGLPGPTLLSSEEGSSAADCWSSYQRAGVTQVKGSRCLYWWYLHSSF